MKKIIRHYCYATFSLWCVGQIASGLVFGQGIRTLLITGGAVTLVSLFAKPIINLLLLPVNIITFGLFRWLSSGVILYLATLLVPEFKVMGFNFNGLATPWIKIPTINLSGLFSYVGFSFVYSLITSFLFWIRK